MKNYNNLRTLLDDIKNIVVHNRKNTDIKKIINGYEAFGASIWQYNISRGDFKLANSNEITFHHEYKDLKMFLNDIKTCFKSYYIQFLILYLKLICSEEESKTTVSYELRSFLPVRQKNSAYDFTGLFVLPEIVNNKIEEIYFLSLPLKEHVLEPISIYIASGFKKDVFITYKIKEQIVLDFIFTKQQERIFKLLVDGFSSSTIASVLDKKPDNVLRYNVRITDRLSSFFDIEFITVKEAVEYYYKCFLS